MSKKRSRKRRAQARKLDRVQSDSNSPVSDEAALTEAEEALQARQEAEQRAQRTVRRAKRSSRSSKSDGVSSKVAADLLANPTTDVSVEELQTQYHYVASDLRNMFILSGALFGVLVLLGFLV